MKARIQTAVRGWSKMYNTERQNQSKGFVMTPRSKIRQMVNGWTDLTEHALTTVDWVSAVPTESTLRG